MSFQLMVGNTRQEAKQLKMMKFVINQMKVDSQFYKHDFQSPAGSYYVLSIIFKSM